MWGDRHIYVWMDAGIDLGGTGVHISSNRNINVIFIGGKDSVTVTA